MLLTTDVCPCVCERLWYIIRNRRFEVNMKRSLQCAFRQIRLISALALLEGLAHKSTSRAEQQTLSVSCCISLKWPQTLVRAGSIWHVFTERIFFGQRSSVHKKDAITCRWAFLFNNNCIQAIFWEVKCTFYQTGKQSRAMYDFLEWEGLNHCVYVFYSALVQLRRQERRKKKQKRKREEEAKKKLQKVV